MSWDELQRPGARDRSPSTASSCAAAAACGCARARGADVFDIALAGRVAVVEAIEEDMEGAVHLVGHGRRRPGPRPRRGAQLAPPLLLRARRGRAARRASARILVAGIGNVFLGDDGFGVALAERLAARALPPGVEVVDYGIRGMDLAYALGDGWDAVVLLDAAPTGQPPGHAVRDRARARRASSPRSTRTGWTP